MSVSSYWDKPGINSHNVAPSTVDGVTGLLHFITYGKLVCKFQNEAFFIRDKNCHLMFCWRLMELNCECESVKKNFCSVSYFWMIPKVGSSLSAAVLEKKTFSRWKEKKFSQSWNGICWIWHILLFQKIIHGSDFQVRFSPFEHLPFLFFACSEIWFETNSGVDYDGWVPVIWMSSLQWGNLNEGLVLSWEDALLHY